MKRVRYTKFTGDLSSSFGLEDLMQASPTSCSTPASTTHTAPGSRSSTATRPWRTSAKPSVRPSSPANSSTKKPRKIQPARRPASRRTIDKIIEKMQEQNFINAEQPEDGQGQQGDGNGEARFEVTTRAWTSSATKPSFATSRATLASILCQFHSWSCCHIVQITTTVSTTNQASTHVNLVAATSLVRPSPPLHLYPVSCLIAHSL